MKTNQRKRRMMVRTAWPLTVILAMAAPALAQTEPVHPDPIIVLPSHIPWSGKPGSNQTATLMGDQKKPGPFISLLDWVSGNISTPHYHLKSRTFIVLKGHWDFGSGAKYDTASMKALPEGTAVTVPAGSILYDGCKQAPCLVETVGDGDDPEFMVDEKGRTIPPPKGN
jgi:hypothetical protein